MLLDTHGSTDLWYVLWADLAACVVPNSKMAQAHCLLTSVTIMIHLKGGCKELSIISSFWHPQSKINSDLASERRTAIMLIFLLLFFVL